MTRPATSEAALTGAPQPPHHPGGARSRTVWLALGIVYVAWGSTYVAIRVMDRTIEPLIGAGVRYLGAGAAMLALITLLRGRVPRVRARELASVVLVATLLLAAGNGGVTYAESHVPAGLAALLVASMPLWILVLRTFAGDRPRRATLAGLAVGFVGVALLVLRGGQQQGVSTAHMLIVVAAALAWAIGSWLSARLPLPEDVAVATALEMLVGGVVLAAMAPALGERWSGFVSGASIDSVLALAYLALVGSIVAFTAYAWLLQHAPISQISTYAYVNPAVALVLAAVLLGESVTSVTLLGGAVIIFAVALVIRAEATA